ncbi:2-oxo-4-hydroxy-4-carboxy-5-ureidoimidazoline decarboxylase [Alsobacter sp. SYSU BS001988]
MTLADVNALSPGDFVAAFGGVAEHSAWVAERAEAARPYASVNAMVTAFQAAILQAGEDEKTALLQAHPDLAGRAAVAGRLTRESAREQSGAGLGGLSEEEFARFTALNEAYRARFGIPFILAVKGAGKTQILEAFENRVGGTMAEERLTALAQVLRIVRFRLVEQVVP